MGRAKQYCLFLSVFVIYVCLKREKNLTLKSCAPDFSARSMTKLYAKIKGARAISLSDFPKTWQVCLPEIHTIEKGDFLKLIIHSQII